MIVFLKMGGSLITEKDRPYTVRVDVIRRIADEINQAIKENPDLKVVLGHGSGSFGHTAAVESGFGEEVSSKNQWLAFQSVWAAAHALNDLVMTECRKRGLPLADLKSHDGSPRCMAAGVCKLNQCRAGAPTPGDPVPVFVPARRCANRTSKSVEQRDRSHVKCRDAA